MKTLTVETLAKQLQSGAQVTLVDVREPVEVSAGTLPNAVHISLATLPSRLNELQPDHAFVVFCHHGSRSAQAVEFMERAGYANVANLTGGIDAWSRKIDPAIPLY